MFSIRAPTETDADSMALLADELGYPTDSRTLRERLALLLGRSDYLIAVAEAEAGRVCGWIQAQRSLALESGFRVEIVGLVVSKAMQRRGIGRVLVRSEEHTSELQSPYVISYAVF